MGFISAYNKSFAEVTLVDQLVPADFMRETLQLISIDLTGMQQLLDVTIIINILGNRYIHIL